MIDSRICLSFFFCSMALAAQDEVTPSAAQRSEERARLTQQRQALEDRYKQEAKQCYQLFDVSSCRQEARNRRIAAHEALRKEEIRFNAMERHIEAAETRRSLMERNLEAERKKTQAEHAAVAASKEQADDNHPKQLDPALQGTKRDAYEKKQRDAAQHRADVEKKMRERNKEPAAPLPVPGQ